MRYPLAVLATVVAAYALGYYLSVPGNPEVKFWQTVIKRRDAEIQAVRAEHPGTPIVFFTGGSSTAFSIDPKIIEERCGIPCFNLGLPVATGGKYLLHQALERAQSGDIIIVSLEDGFFTVYEEDGKPTKLSFALSAAGGKAAESAGGSTFGYKLTLNDYLTFSRPGVGLLPTLIARKLINKPYRYSTEDMRYRGRIETPYHDPELIPAGLRGETHLVPDTYQLLSLFKKAAAAKNVKVAYALPWFYTTTENLTDCRQEKAEILNEIATIMPVIEDGYFGAANDINWFADSSLHLSSEGSRIRSEAVAKPLSDWLKTSSSLKPHSTEQKN